MASTSRLVYDERLTATRAWWAIAVPFGFALAPIFLPYGAIAALIALSRGRGRRYDALGAAVGPMPRSCWISPPSLARNCSSISGFLTLTIQREPTRYLPP